MRETQTRAEGTDDAQGWSSSLLRGRERFLAHVIEHGLQIGRRSPEDFLRHFPPMAIMESLRDQPPLRAAIVSHTTGIKPGVALKKSWESCGEDLQIALDEGETNAEAVLATFKLDDRVRFLDAQKLWAFVTEGEFWKAPSTRHPDIDMARPHVAFMLERALEDRLLTHLDVVEGITVDELAARLPKSELGNIIKLSLANAKSDTPFTERDLLAAVPSNVLVNYIPLAHLWTQVIVQRVAERHGYVEVREREDGAAAAAKVATAEEVKPANDVVSSPKAAIPAAKPEDAPDRATPIAMKPTASALPVAPAPAPASEGLASSAPVKPSVARHEAQKNAAARAEKEKSSSDVTLKRPSKRASSPDTIDPSQWSAEVGENDLLEEEELGMEEVVNS